MPNQIKSIHLRHRLVQRLNNEKVELSYTLLAGYLLNHYDDLKNLSIEKVCEDNYISFSTLRRFCQSLGYDNFTDLKESKQEEYNEHKAIAFNIEESIKNLFSKFDYMDSDIHDIISHIKNHEMIFILFPSELYSAAFSFQQQFLTVNKYLYLVPNIDNIFPYITKALENSLVIILDSNEEYTDSALSYLCDINCKKIAISNYVSTQEIWDKQIKIPSPEQSLIEKYAYSFILDDIYIKYTNLSNER